MYPNPRPGGCLKLLCFMSEFQLITIIDYVIKFHNFSVLQICYKANNNVYQVVNILDVKIKFLKNQYIYERRAVITTCNS